MNIVVLNISLLLSVFPFFFLGSELRDSFTHSRIAKRNKPVKYSNKLLEFSFLIIRKYKYFDI